MYILNRLDYSDAVSLDILTRLMYPRGPGKGGLLFLKQFEVCTYILDLATAHVLVKNEYHNYCM
jgi:hypothetical protein